MRFPDWLREHKNQGLATHTYMRELEELCVVQHEALSSVGAFRQNGGAALAAAATFQEKYQ